MADIDIAFGAFPSGGSNQSNTNCGFGVGMQSKARVIQQINNKANRMTMLTPVGQSAPSTSAASLARRNSTGKASLDASAFDSPGKKVSLAERKRQSIACTADLEKNFGFDLPAALAADDSFCQNPFDDLDDADADPFATVQDAFNDSGFDASSNDGFEFAGTDDIFKAAFDQKPSTGGNDDDESVTSSTSSEEGDSGNDNPAEEDHHHKEGKEGEGGERKKMVRRSSTSRTTSSSSKSRSALAGKSPSKSSRSSSSKEGGEKSSSSGRKSSTARRRRSINGSSENNENGATTEGGEGDGTRTRRRSVGPTTARRRMSSSRTSSEDAPAGGEEKHESGQGGCREAPKSRRGSLQRSRSDDAGTLVRPVGGRDQRRHSLTRSSEGVSHGSSNESERRTGSRRTKKPEADAAAA